MSPKATKTATAVAVLPASRQSKLAVGFVRAKKTSTPLVQVETPDPSASMRVLIDEALALAVKYHEPEPPFILWDAVRGLRGMEGRPRPKEDKTPDPGTLALQAALKKAEIAVEKTFDPMLALQVAAHLGKNAYVFMLNAHRFLDTVEVMQAVWNLRDDYKATDRMLVLLGAFFRTPIELQGSVITLLEELPDREALAKVVIDQFANTCDVDEKALPPPSAEVVQAATDALIGLSMFTAEQVTAMALGPDGLDMDVLWEHKINAIQQTPGLKIERGVPGEDGLEFVKGMDNAVQYFRELIRVHAFSITVLVEELEKAVAGGMADFSGDSGVAKDQIATFLTFMNDRKVRGVLMAGISGTGKSFVAKAIAATSGTPLVLLDMGAMKDSSIGESEGRIRTALKVLDAIAGGKGRILLIATANKTATVSPELSRRISMRFFADNPGREARQALWDVYATRDGLRPDQCVIPPGWDEGWTGDEIQKATENAKLFGQTVAEVSKWVMPSAKSHKEEHQALRVHAHHKFLSAHASGWYEAPPEAPAVNEEAFAEAFALTGGLRKINVKDMH